MPLTSMPGYRAGVRSSPEGSRPLVEQDGEVDAVRALPCEGGCSRHGSGCPERDSARAVATWRAVEPVAGYESENCRGRCDQTAVRRARFEVEGAFGKGHDPTRIEDVAGETWIRISRLAGVSRVRRRSTELDSGGRDSERPERACLDGLRIGRACLPVTRSTTRPRRR